MQGGGHLYLVVLLALVAQISGTQGDSFDMNRFCNEVPNGRFVPNPRSCQHWLFCQNNQATEGQCPGIFYFDVNMQMCRYPIYVDCQFDSVDVVCNSDFELHPHPDNCNQYVACIDGFPRVINCAPELHWDRNRELCDVPDNAKCTIQQDVDYYCDPSRTYVTFHPNDCQKFIMCVAGDRRLNRCAPNLLFDPTHLRCDFAHNVNCALPEAEIDYVCDVNRDFYLAPHPRNCQYFILCVGGHRQIERCAEGLMFDWMNLRCDLPHNAVCLAPPS